MNKEITTKTWPLSAELTLSNNRGFIDNEFKYNTYLDGAVKGGALYPLHSKDVYSLSAGETYIDYIDGHTFTLQGNTVCKDGVALKSFSSEACFKVENTGIKIKDLVSIGTVSTTEFYAYTSNAVYRYVNNNPQTVFTTNSRVVNAKQFQYGLYLYICLLYYNGSFTVLKTQNGSVLSSFTKSPTYVQFYENDPKDRTTAFTGQGTLTFEVSDCYSGFQTGPLGVGILVSITDRVGINKAKDVSIYTGCFGDGNWSVFYESTNVNPSNMSFYNPTATGQTIAAKIFPTLHYVGDGRWDCIGCYYDPCYGEDATENVIQFVETSEPFMYMNITNPVYHFVHGPDGGEDWVATQVYKPRRQAAKVYPERLYGATYITAIVPDATVADFSKTIIGWSVGKNETNVIYLTSDEKGVYPVGVYSDGTPPATSDALTALELDDVPTFYYPGLITYKNYLLAYDGTMLAMVSTERRGATNYAETLYDDCNTVGAASIKTNLRAGFYSKNGEIYSWNNYVTPEYRYTLGNRYLVFNAAGANTYDAKEDRWLYSGCVSSIHEGYGYGNADKYDISEIWAYNDPDVSLSDTLLRKVINWDSSSTFGTGYNLNYEVTKSNITGLNSGAMVLWSAPRVRSSRGSDREAYNDIGYYFDDEGSGNIPYIGSQVTLQGTYFPVNSGVFWPISPFTKINKSYNNCDSVTTGINSYLLLYYVQDVLNVYKTATQVPESKAFFTLQSQSFAQLGDHLVALNYDSSGSLSNIEELVNIEGMTYIGNIPSVAYFYSSTDRAIYAFTGDANLQLYAQSTAFVPTGFLYNTSNSDVVVPGYLDGNISTLVIGSANSYLVPFTVVKVEDGRLVYIENDTVKYLGWDIAEPTLKRPLILRTALLGTENYNALVLSGAYIRVLKDDVQDGSIDVTVYALNNGGVEKHVTTTKVKDIVFDDFTKTGLVVVDLGSVQALGKSIEIRSALPIVDITFEAKEISGGSNSVKKARW